MLKFESQDNGDFKVYYDNGVYMGDLSRDHDLNFNFWPLHPSNGGFWPSHCLREIVMKLDELNKPIDQDYMRWLVTEEKRKQEDSEFDKELFGETKTTENETKNGTD